MSLPQAPVPPLTNADQRSRKYANGSGFAQPERFFQFVPRLCIVRIISAGRFVSASVPTPEKLLGATILQSLC
jgi:hypothetical protein